MSRIVNGLKNITIVFLLLILSFNLYSLYQRNVNDSRFPMAFGYGYAVVASGSMEPALSWGDLVVIRQLENYKDGDIITFIQEGDQRPIELSQLTMSILSRKEMLILLRILRLRRIRFLGR